MTAFSQSGAKLVDWGWSGRRVTNRNHCLFIFGDHQQVSDPAISSEPQAWLLFDDRAGNRAQCEGVAAALGVAVDVKKLAYGWLGNLPNGLLGASFAGLTSASRAGLMPPWPDIVIAAGRRTASVARQIKRLSNGRTRLVQIMDPGPSGADEFDLIVIPNHDDADTAVNVMRITGAPHGVTEARLAAARKTWGPALGALASPRIAVIVGGSTRRRQFTEQMAVELSGMASAMATSCGGSLMVTTSRRTGEAASALIGAITVPAEVHRWHSVSQNPYLGYLAWAQAVIVTGDSMSMCSEACAQPGPVYIYGPPALISVKHLRLHRELFTAGYARPLDGSLVQWTHPPLNAAETIAAAVRLRFGF